MAQSRTHVIFLGSIMHVYDLHQPKKDYEPGLLLSLFSWSMFFFSKEPGSLTGPFYWSMVFFGLMRIIIFIHSFFSADPLYSGWFGEMSFKWD